MAIDLPPAVPPTLVNSSYIADYASSASAYNGKVGSFEFQVTGDHQLSGAELDKIFETAKSADQAILLISSATNRKGHLLVNTLYSRQQNVVQVHALQARLGDVSGDEAITGFFEGLEGDADLKRSEFDRARAMASVKSERTGVDYSVSYQSVEADPGVINMVFEAAPDEDADRTDLNLGLNNEGSRFVGRYFVNAGVSHNTMGGTSLGLDYQTAMTEWGESREGDDYDQISLNISRPFSFGLYGIRASQTEYTQDFSTSSPASCQGLLGIPISLAGICLGGFSPAATTSNTFDAEITRIAVTGEQVLSSDIDRRFTLNQELEVIDSQFDDQSGASLQDEMYTTLELGGKYDRKHRLGDRKLNYTLALSAKGGIDDDGGTLESMPNAAGVAVGKRVGDFLIVKPRATVEIDNRKGTTLSFRFSAQLADDQLPQQQQFVLGGTDTLASHLPGVIVGDSGMFARLGLSHKLVDLDSFTLVGGIFAAYGEANFEEASGAAGDTLSLSDAGVSLTGSFEDDVEVSLVLADSLSEKNIDDDFLDRAEADFFASVKVAF